METFYAVVIKIWGWYVIKGIKDCSNENDKMGKKTYPLKDKTYFKLLHIMYNSGHENCTREALKSEYWRCKLSE